MPDESKMQIASETLTRAAQNSTASVKDMVKSPSHYTGVLGERLGIEVIDIANVLNLNGNRFSILRYVLRAGLKDPAKEIEDLEKIKEYADFEVRRLRGEPVSRTSRKREGFTNGND